MDLFVGFPNPNDFIELMDLLARQLGSMSGIGTDIFTKSSMAQTRIIWTGPAAFTKMMDLLLFPPMENKSGGSMVKDIATTALLLFPPMEPSNITKTASFTEKTALLLLTKTELRSFI